MSEVAPAAKKLSPELLLVAFASFLAPIIGGHVPREAIPLDGSVGSEIMGGAALPLMTRFLLGSLIFVALIAVLIRRRVVQTPSIWLTGSLALFFTALGLSYSVTQFPDTSIVAWITWFTMIAAFFATVSSVGRKVGVIVVMTAVVAGCGIVALKGVVEYAQIMKAEPTYRIFAGWVNPNATAGILLLGLPLGLALVGHQKGPNRILAVVASTLMVLALILTQSKGGYLSAALGLGAMAAFAASTKNIKAIGLGLVPIAIASLMFVGLQAASKAPAGGAMSRISSGTEQEQSAGFRKLLWQGTIEIAKKNPIGVGIGTYRFHSAQPGLTEQTMFSHQTYLQLAAEGGIASLIALAGFAGLWLLKFFPGSKKMPAERNLLRAGILGAVVAGAANGFVESNVYYFGIGLILFVIVGLGVQLSQDASSPELFPASLRFPIAVTVAVFPLIFLCLQGITELKKATFLTTLTKPNGGPPDVSALPDDSEGLYMQALYGGLGPTDQLALMTQSVERGPTTRQLRGLARVAASSPSSMPTAQTALERALTFDPNNLSTLEQAYQLSLEMGDKERAQTYAERLVAVEQTPYFKVRALPDFVPTQTFDAHFYLADQTPDRAKKLEHLQAGVTGYKKYLELTWPKLIDFAEAKVPFPGGETVEEAKAKFKIAESFARLLAKLQLESGDKSGSAETEVLAGRFAEAAS